MATFLVPRMLMPGAMIPGQGLVASGQRFVWTAARGKGPKPNLHLIPIDEDAHTLLVEAWGAEKVLAEHGEWKGPPVIAAPQPERGMTAAEAAAEADPQAHVAAVAAGRKRKRLADS